MTEDKKNNLPGTFAERLKSFMDARKLTQKMVADDAKVSQTAVFKWLNGSQPGAMELFNLASTNGVAVEWFLKAPQNDELTTCATNDINTDVKHWPQLKRRIQKAASKPGAKTMLKDFLRVDKTQLSKWLSDGPSEREPGAEYTLQLLKWVEQEEAKQKSPGSVIAPPEPKTRSMKSTNENIKTSPP